MKCLKNISYLFFLDELLLLRFDPLLEDLEDVDLFTVPRLEDDLDDLLTLPRLDEDREELFTVPLPDDDRVDLFTAPLLLSNLLLVDLTPDFPELLRTLLLILDLTGTLDRTLESEDLMTERFLIVVDLPLLLLTRALLSVKPVRPVRRTSFRIAERVLELTVVVRLP